MENSTSYKQRIKRHTPPSSIVKNCSFAALFGGSICLFGEIIAEILINAGAEVKNAYTTVTFILIAIAAILTAAGVFDRIARIAGAGTLVPVTGFANSVVSPAIDNRSEGLVLGVGAKIFTVAGPVILYGSLAGVVYGIIYYILSIV